jgi:hypothetical protein
MLFGGRNHFAERTWISACQEMTGKGSAFQSILQLHTGKLRTTTLELLLSELVGARMQDVWVISSTMFA